MGAGLGAREQALEFPRQNVRRLHCRRRSFPSHRSRDLVKVGRLLLLTAVGIIHWEEYKHSE